MRSSNDLHWLILAAALATAGCASPIAQVQPAEAHSTSSAAVPESVPLVPFGGFARLIARGESEHLVLESLADLDAFVARHPAVGTETPRTRFERTDFAAYQGILVHEATAHKGDELKIVSVEEQPERFVVHAIHFTYDEPLAPEPEPFGVMDVVGLPRTTKPIEFAPIRRTVLKRSRPGGAEQPVWKAVPNPLATRDRMLAPIIKEYATSRLESVFLERRTLAWVAENLPELPDHPAWGYTPDSEVWVAILVGDLSRSTAYTSGFAPAEAWTGKLIQLYAIDNSRLLQSTPIASGTK